MMAQSIAEKSLINKMMINNWAEKQHEDKIKQLKDVLGPAMTCAEVEAKKSCRESRDEQEQQDDLELYGGDHVRRTADESQGDRRRTKGSRP